MNNNSNRDYATENINLKQQVINLKVSNKDKAETIKAMKQELLEYSQLRDRFKVLYEENQELKEQLKINETLSNAFEKQAFKVVEENEKLKKEIAELKDQVAYFKEEFEGWQSAYEWSQAQNAILKLKIQELEEVKNEN